MEGEHVLNGGASKLGNIDKVTNAASSVQRHNLGKINLDSAAIQHVLADSDKVVDLLSNGSVLEVAGHGEKNEFLDLSNVLVLVSEAGFEVNLDLNGELLFSEGGECRFAVNEGLVGNNDDLLSILNKSSDVLRFVILNCFLDVSGEGFEVLSTGDWVGNADHGGIEVKEYIRLFG